jgi:hypothetical protein
MPPIGLYLDPPAVSVHIHSTDLERHHVSRKTGRGCHTVLGPDLVILFLVIIAPRTPCCCLECERPDIIASVTRT